MRDLFQFFVKYRVVFLFLLLEIISFSFIVQYNNFHRVRFLNSSNRISGNILNRYNSTIDFFSLKQVNKELSEENARLMLENEVLRNRFNEIDTSIQIPEVDTVSIIIAAKVTNNSTNKFYNYITLNKGALDGVKPDMGIICPDGVVGVVINVSDHWSLALSVLNSRWSINSKLLNTNYFGTLRWQGNNPKVATLYEIPFHVNVNVGDTIVSSGYSSIFPEGVMIGVVSDVNNIKGDNFLQLKIDLSTNFSNLSFVNIVGNVFKEELMNLENETTDE